MSTTTAVVSTIISTLSVQDNKVAASSRDVAKAFGKQHRDVVRAIDLLDCSPEFRLRNFAQSSFDHCGNTYPFYEMTRDGFVFLAMGFTGKKAAMLKEAYIEAFSTAWRRSWPPGGNRRHLSPCI